MESPKPITLRSRIISGFAIAIALYIIYYTSGLHAELPWRIVAMPHTAISLTMILILTVLVYGIKGNRGDGPLQWHDYILLVMGVVPSMFFFFFWENVIRLVPTGPIPTSAYEVLSFSLVLALVESGRRIMGLGLSVTALVFFIHPFVGKFLPGILHAPPTSTARIAFFLYAGSSGIWGFALNVATTVVFPFVIFSYFMLQSGAGRFFINLALSFFGGVRGGPAKVAIFASCLFGTLSGSPAANAVATGTLTIPLMKKVGYSPEFSGGVESVASNGGAIMPPVMGSVAFVMAEFINIPYAKLIVFAALPALLYYWALYVQVDVEAARLKLAGIPRDQLPSRNQTVKEGWFYLLPVVFLIVTLAVYQWSASKAALSATVLVILVSQFDSQSESRIRLRSALKALGSASTGMCMIVVACALAGIIIGSIGITALGVQVANLLVGWSGGSLLALAFIALAASFILGLSLTPTPVYVTLAVLVIPAIVANGVPVVAAHLSVVYWGIMGAITPPVATTAFVAAGIAGANPMRTGWLATKLGIGALLVPIAMMYNPALVGIGDGWIIATTFVVALVGMASLGVAFIGYLNGSLNWPKRIAFGVAGLLVFVPIWPLRISTIIGIAILYSWQYLVPRLLGRTKVGKGSAAP